MKSLRNSSLLRDIRSILYVWVLCSLIAPSAHAFDSPLRTEPADPSELTGTFTLILYGGRYADDIETVAIFSPEGGPYTFSLYAPDFDFTTEKGRPAREALERAGKFVGFHPAFWRSQLSRILGPSGNTIGYELRPLYRPFIYGSSDVMQVLYRLKQNNTVRVTIRLIPSVERQRSPGGPHDLPSGD